MTERPAHDSLEATLGRVLGIGVRFSTITLAAGLAAALAFDRSTLTTVLLTTGIVVLVATPIARVAISCLTYLRRRDWTFVVLTLIVLGELLASIVAAIRSRT
jgi:uncharacterized membrane protein